MKVMKLGAMFVLSCVLCCALAWQGKTLCLAEGDCYYFYVGNTSKRCSVVRVEKGARLRYLFLWGVNGQATKYPELDVGEYLASVGGEVLFTETLCDSVNYYCSARLPYCVNLYGKQINLHICVKEGEVLVGSPILFGGY